MSYFPRTVAAAFLAASSFAGAETASDPSNDQSDLYRVVNERSSNVPDGVAFRLAVTMMASLADSDPEFALEWVQQEFETDRTGALEIVELMRGSSKAIESDIDVEMQEIGCSAGVSKFSGDDSYTALQDMEDAIEVVAARHYEDFKRRFDQATQDKAREWVESKKLQAGHRKYDQRKLSQAVGKSGEERLQDICLNLHSQTMVGPRREVFYSNSRRCIAGDHIISSSS